MTTPDIINASFACGICKYRLARANNILFVKGEKQ